MANRTVKDAVTVKGTNPQYLIEKIIRSRIYESKYWKEYCFALTGKSHCQSDSHSDWVSDCDCECECESLSQSQVSQSESHSVTLTQLHSQSITDSVTESVNGSVNHSHTHWLTWLWMIHGGLTQSSDWVTQSVTEYSSKLPRVTTKSSYDVMSQSVMLRVKQFSHSDSVLKCIDPSSEWVIDGTCNIPFTFFQG